jgi:Protein of unknown function (DUF3253)
MTANPDSDPAHDYADRDVVRAIDRLLRARAADATICPSEVARELAGEDGSWRAAMPRIRDVAAGMVDAGRLRVTRRGLDVDARSAGGPIRLGRLRTSQAATSDRSSRAPPYRLPSKQLR